MDTVKIPWDGATGGNIVIGVPGPGDGPASISSDTPNEGVDRYMEITFRTGRPRSPAGRTEGIPPRLGR